MWTLRNGAGNSRAKFIHAMIEKDWQLEKQELHFFNAVPQGGA